MTFPDHFSESADHYLRFRPNYPRPLYERLAELAPGHERCWDVATGSGQAAVSLADFFAEVIATDASADQVARALPHPRVRYRVERAEASSLADASVDLVTIAAGLHWLDVDAFYREVLRVTRAGAIVAAWSYGTHAVVDPAIDAIVARYASDVLADYWSTHYIHVRSRYLDLPFPFAEVPMPALSIRVEWSVDDLLGAMGTWSASTIFRRQTGSDPTDVIRADMLTAWGDAPTRTVEMPLFFRVGRVGAP
ncbi:MAG TPA: class I SAM-dependent methyltransferase [Nannocystaceae bacterium]|nr:class I SAM-dependent methyltransferase [Nannocystaceae bacterium]